ncbi:hypothetical protein SAMN03159284_03169 [Mucilaginibacter sp. NFR10]|nr:hypothetical protein SAMN03159284_03169 [Mucilaginibacter sp. NFR10]
MEIAIMASLLAKGDMYVNAGHFLSVSDSDKLNLSVLNVLYR